jgi:trans-aconitate methyltransferase
MSANEQKSHWENIYTTRTPEKFSWTQEQPSPSIEWILDIVPDKSAGIIDVGAGTSRLVDYLLDAGYVNPAVLDISSKALSQAQERLGDLSAQIEWIEADVTMFSGSRTFMLWHDRAVFHFLIEPESRKQYLISLQKSLRPNGYAIIATFSTTGPKQCSGMDVMQFDETSLATEMGSAFQLERSLQKKHTTPWGSNQDFIYCLFKRD